MTTRNNVGAFAVWLDAMPDGALLPAADVKQQFNTLLGVGEPPPRVQGASWRERLWTAPPQTRIGVSELAEATGRSKWWIYRHTSPSGENVPIPCRRLDGELVFVVGEIRVWLDRMEVVITPGVIDAVVEARLARR